MQTDRMGNFITPYASGERRKIENTALARSIAGDIVDSAPARPIEASGAYQAYQPLRGAVQDKSSHRDKAEATVIITQRAALLYSLSALGLTLLFALMVGWSWWLVPAWLLLFTVPTLAHSVTAWWMMLKYSGAGTEHARINEAGRTTRHAIDRAAEVKKHETEARLSALRMLLEDRHND